MFRRSIFVTLLVVYAITVGIITLRPLPETAASASWVPLVEIWHLIVESEGNPYLDVGAVVGNIALFIPLGWLLPIIWRELRSFRLVLIVAGLCSIIVEVAQFAIPGRSPTTDDVLLNVSGALIGAFMFFAPRATD